LRRTLPNFVDNRFEISDPDLLKGMNRIPNSAKFMARIDEYCPANYMFETPVEGNIHWTFGHDLTVD